MHNATTATVDGLIEWAYSRNKPFFPTEPVMQHLVTGKVTLNGRDMELVLATPREERYNISFSRNPFLRSRI